MFTMIMAILAAPCMAATGVLFILLQKKNREIEAHEYRHKQMIEKLTLLDVDLNKSEDEIDALKDKLGRLKYELKAYQEKDPEWIARNPKGPKGMQGLDFVARCNRDENGERKKNTPDRRARRAPVLNSPIQSRPQVNELPVQSDNLLEGLVLGAVVTGIAGSDIERGQPVFQGAGGEFLGGGASGSWEIAPPKHDIVFDDSVKPYTTDRESIIACEPEPVKETYSSAPAYESPSYSDSGSSSSSSSSDSCSSSSDSGGGGGCD